MRSDVESQFDCRSRAKNPEGTGLRRRRASAAGVVCSLLMVVSCTVGPDFQPPAPPAVGTFLPAAGNGVGGGGDHVAGRRVVRGGEVPSRWWETFRSPDLKRLIEEGLAHNADLEAAEAAVRVAQASALAAQSALFPLVTANVQSSRQQVPAQTLASGAAWGADLYSVHTAQVSVSLVPDVFGGTRRQIEAARALAEAEAFRREGVYLTLTTNIALAAVQSASLQGQIGATQRLIGIQTQLLNVLRRQYEQGQIALPDVVAQETALAQARLLLPPLERQLAQQQHLLAVLTGRFPSDAPSIRFDLAAFRLPRTLPLSLPADLVRQRPDIRVAEANLHAANAQIGVAIANRLPQITLSGNAGSSAAALGQLFATGTNFWTIAGNAAQTVFDAGALAARQRAAEAATEQAAAQYRAVILAAFQNVADVLRALQSGERALAAATAAERSAAHNIELVRRQVEQGQVSIPILLNAQQAYLQTSLLRVQAEAARLADTIALFQALGGGWWNRPPSPQLDSAAAAEAPKPIDRRPQ